MPEEAKTEFLYKLKRDKLTMKDMKIFWQIRKGKMGDDEIYDWLDQMVEGGVAHIPYSQFSEVFAQIFIQFYELENPKDAEGKVSKSA
jgi:hypothetical protein